jgi:hypothetical protein
MGTGTAGLASVFASQYDIRTFVETLREDMQLLKFGRRNDPPRGEGKIVRWNQFAQGVTAVDTVAITEGGEPLDSTDFASTGTTATLLEYGGVTEFSKFLDLTALSGTRQEFVKGLAHKAALSIDRLISTELLNATNKNNEGVALTADGLRKAVIELQDNDARPHSATPGGAFYPFVGSVEQVYDVYGEGSPAWFQARTKDLELSSPKGNVAPGAAIYNVLMYITTSIPRSVGPVPDDDNGYMFAAEPFGVSSLDSNVMEPRIIITEPEALVSAPLRNRGTAAYWFLFISKILDQNQLVQIISDATGIG